MKMWFKSLALAGMTLAFLGSLVGAPARAAAGADVFTDPPKTFPVVQGWYEGRATYYYDFGSNSPALNDAKAVARTPIYVLVTGFDSNGQPQPVADQHNIIDFVPGDPGYSDLWQVNFVTVPAGYTANTVRSLDDVKKAGYPIKETNQLVNCPVVPLNSSLAEGTPGLTKGWYKGKEAHYFDFGPSPDFTLPIYAFITGMDSAGNPQFVPGQHNIIDVIPGQGGYSPFWDVHLVKVPADYQANSITSIAQAMASGYEMIHPGIVVNCPVIRTDAAPNMGGTPGMPTTGAASEGALFYLIGLAGALFAAGLLMRRYNTFLHLGTAAQQAWWRRRRG
jgi:hypothetical protein